jgi:hypothetical protein
MPVKPLAKASGFMVVSSLLLFGQATLGTGSIHGVVYDASGAVVAGAHIKLLDTGRDLTRDADSNAAGVFLFPDIPAASYKLRVSKPGFATLELTQVRLEVGQTGNLEVTLRPGEIQSVITVSAGHQLLLENESNVVGTVVGAEQVSNLPLNGRNFLRLALLAGGSNEPVGRSSIIPLQLGLPDRGVVLAGNLPYMSGYLINGIATRGSRQGESAVNLSIAAIDQFKIQESFFLPDQGPNPGLVNVVTKSGTNGLHGEVFYYVRNQVFDARNFFAQTPEDLKRNQFGGAIGGPIRRDRAWFFAHYEGLRDVVASAATAFTPTPAMFQGDFRELGNPIFDPDSFSSPTGRLPFRDNIIPPNRINQVSRNLLEYYLPGSSFSQRPNNLFGTARRRLTEDQGGGRADISLTPKQTLFAQYIESHVVGFQGQLFPVAGTAYPNSSRLAMLQHTWTITPATVATTRIGFVRNSAQLTNEAADQGPILADAGVENTFDNRGITSITLQNFAGFGQATGDVGNLDNNYQFDYGVHHLRGRHDIQGGAGIRYKRTGQQNANFTAHGALFFQPTYTAQVDLIGDGQFRPRPSTGSDFADFLLGTPSLGQMAGLPRLGYRWTQYMPYLQDTWKILPNLTANYGIAWFLATVPEPQGLARDWAHGFDWSSGLLTYAALGEVDPRILRTDLNNFAPRFGIAWSPRFLPRTVIRAGAGIFYSDVPSSFLQHATLAPPFADPIILAIDPLDPTPPYRFGKNLFPARPAAQLYPGFAADVPVGASPRVLHSDGLTPFVQQWNLSFQHSLTENQLIELVYLGSSTHRLTNVYDLAQCKPDPDNRCRPETRAYSRYGSLMVLENNGNSSYQAGVAKFQYRTPGGVNVRAEYTFAKALTDTSEIGITLEHQIASCRRCEKSLTAFDQRHRFVLSGIFPIPFGRGQKIGGTWSPWVDALFGGWQSNAIATFSTGPPIDQIAPNTTASALIFHRPDRICDGRDDALTGNLRNNGFQYYDPACFVPASPGFFGNAGRNIVGSPGINNWDIGLSKQFPISEGKRLDFRVELFNAWNHAQFGSPNRFLGPNFGRVSTARPPRLMQLGLKLYW